MLYKIIIEEYKQNEINVEAKSPKEAENIAKHKYFKNKGEFEVKIVEVDFYHTV